MGAAARPCAEDQIRNPVAVDVADGHPDAAHEGPEREGARGLRAAVRPEDPGVRTGARAGPGEDRAASGKVAGGDEHASRESTRAGHQAVDGASEPHDVELARRVLAERRDRQTRVEEDLHGPVLEHEDLAGAEVGKDVRAQGQRPRGPPVHIAADDRAPAACVRVLRDRRNEPGPARGRAEPGAPGALEDPPAVVAAPGDDVDLLAGALTDVAGEELAGSPVEGEPERIPKPVGPDLVAERVVGRNVRGRGVDVEPQDLAQQGPQALRVIVGVIATAAVTHPHVEAPVRPELHHAPVVVAELPVRNRLQDQLGPGVRDVGIRAGDLIARDEDVAGGVRVADVEEAVRRIARVKGEAEEPTLAPILHAVGDVQEDACGYGARLQDLDPPSLLHDEEAAAPVSRVGDVERAAEPLEHRLQPDRARVGRREDGQHRQHSA